MIVIIIPAKGKSRRLSNKNMRKINGKKLLEYTINYAKKSKLTDEIYVSSDTKKIIKFAKNNKVKTIFRTEELGGETPIKKVYLHALNNIEKKKLIKIIIGLQPDHPDRLLNLDKLITKFKSGNFDISKSYNKKSKINDGAYYLMTRKHLKRKVDKNIKIMKIYDNCTNIHTLNDLKKVEKKLKNEKKNYM